MVQIVIKKRSTGSNDYQAYSIQTGGHIFIGHQAPRKHGVADLKNLHQGEPYQPCTPDPAFGYPDSLSRRIVGPGVGPQMFPLRDLNDYRSIIG